MFSEISPDGATFTVVENADEQTVSLSVLLKSLFFRVALRHQPSIKKSKVKGSLKTWLQLLFVVVNTVQVLSLSVEYTFSIDDYDSYRYFHQFAQGVRPDIWVLTTGQAVAGVLVSVSLLALILTTLGLEAVIEHFSPDYKLHASVRLVIDWPLEVIQKFLYIPLMLLYFRAMKETLFSSKPSDPQFDSVWKGIICIPGCVGYMSLVLIRIGFVYENAWMLRSHRLLSHIDYVYELKECIVFTIVCVVSVIDMSSMLNLAISGALTMYLFLQLLWFVPYYHPITYLLKGLEFGICSWGSLCGFVGLATSSMTVTVKLFVFVAPCIGLLIAHLFNWRVELSKFERVTKPFWKFELAIRRLFEKFNEEEDTGIDAELKQSLEFGAKLYAGKNKEYYLLMGHYYYYLREESEIALLRLTSSVICPGNILSEFQIYRLSQALYQVSKSEERDFVDYQSMYQNSRSLDCKLCEMTYDLLNILINKNTNETLLERSFLNLAKAIRMSQESYRDLKSKFPNDPFVLQSYGTFIGDLFHEPISTDLITRGYFELNRRKKTHINTIESYSSVDTGVMIVSCHQNLYGKITFANEQLGKILGCKHNEIIGKDLDDFIPPPYNYKHNNKLISFLARGEAREIFRSHLFLSSNQKFSVEVTFRFRPTVVQETPYFVVAVRPKPNTREFAIFDTNYVITSHSLFFPSSIAIMDRKALTGERLDNLIPGILAYADRDHANGFIYRHQEKGVNMGMKFAEVSLGKGTIHWLYVITNERGIDDLFINTAGEEVAVFKRGLKGSTISSEDRVPEESEKLDVHPKPTPEFKPISKDIPPFHSLGKETKDEVTVTTSVVTSYAKSSAGTHIRRQTNRAVIILKISYLVMILLMTVLLVISLAVLYATLQNISQSAEAVELGLSRLHLAKIMHLARRINLAQSGFEIAVDKSTLQGRLSTEITSLNSVMDKYLKQESDVVMIGSLINGKYSMVLTPLITALTDFNTHAQFQVDTPAVSQFSSDFYYTYYNGVSALMHGLNETIDKYVVSMGRKGTTVIALTAGAAFLLMALVLVGSNLCIARSLYQLETCYSKLWKLVVNVPTLRAREIMNIHKDRIELVHGTEYLAVEQSRLRENRSMMRPPKRRTAIIAKISLFAFGSAAFILFALFYGYREVDLLLNTNCGYVNEVSYSTLIPTLTLHLLKEYYLSVNSASSYFDIVKEEQHLSSLMEELKDWVSDMETMENKILRNMGDISESANAALFSNLNLAYYSACSFLNTTAACEDTSLAKGQHPTITELKLLLWDSANRIEQGTIQWNELAKLEDYIDMITESSVLLLDQTHAYSSASSQRFSSDMLTYSCIYVLASGLLYCLLYLPTIRALKRQCISLWRITTLIRSDYISPKQPSDK